MNEVYTHHSSSCATHKRPYSFMKYNSGLALFDFDGTITSRDTLAEFIIFTEGRFQFYCGLLFLSPVLLLYKLGIMANWRVKEMLFTFFFRKMEFKVFQAKCRAFVKTKLPSLLRKPAMTQIWDHQLRGHRILIVSASPENWVGEWAAQNSVEFIATRLEVQKGLLTGKLFGKNCAGAEKVNRIKQYLNLSEFGVVYTYGDSTDDWPMLKLGSKVNYKPFRV